MSLTTKPKASHSHKKRSAMHHRRNKRYLKTYWPYVPMLLIVGLGFAVNSFLAKHSSVLGASTDFSRSSLLSDTNADRLAYQEPQLTLNNQLNSAAQAKANNMVSNNYWSHDSPTGQTPWSFINGSGYQFQAAGENLAYGFSNASAVMTAWMNSTEHRNNILNANFTNVGFGVAESANYLGKGPEVIVVAEYAEPTTAIAGVSSGVPPLSEPAIIPVSRLQELTGLQVSWLELLITAISGAAAATIIIKHGLYFRKLFIKGESFIIKHPILDILIVLIGTGGVILTRTVAQIG